MGAVNSFLPWNLPFKTHLMWQRSLYYALLLAPVKTCYLCCYLRCPYLNLRAVDKIMGWGETWAFTSEQLHIWELGIDWGLKNGRVRRWTFLPQDDEESEDSSDEDDTEEENDSGDEEKDAEVDEDFRSQLMNVLKAQNVLVCFECLPWYQEVWGGERLLNTCILIWACVVIALAVIFVWHLMQEFRIVKESSANKSLFLLFIVSVPRVLLLA